MDHGLNPHSIGHLINAPKCLPWAGHCVCHSEWDSQEHALRAFRKRFPICIIPRFMDKPLP